MRYAIFGLTILLIFAAGCKEKSIQSKWTSQALTIDGQVDDWNAASFVHMDKNTSISVCNDNEFLYLAARVSGHNQLRVPPNLTLWLDPIAQKNKDWAVYFPAASHADFNPFRGGFWQSLTAEQQRKISDRLDTLNNAVLVVNEKSKFHRLYQPGDTDAFFIAFDKAGDSLSVEAKIPLTFDSSFENLNVSEEGRRLGVGMSFDEWPAPNIHSPQPGMGRAGPDGPIPASEREIPRRRQINRPEELWLEVILANGK